MTYSVNTEIQNLKRNTPLPYLKLVQVFKRKIVNNRDSVINLNNDFEKGFYIWITKDDVFGITTQNLLNLNRRNEKLTFQLNNGKTWVKVIVYLYKIDEQEFNTF